MSSTPLPLRFDGRVALVTGAGTGLGDAYARLLGARGAVVVVNDLNAAAAANTVAAIVAAGGRASAIPGSVEAGDEIVAAALAAHGVLDIVINNAGIVRDRAFHNMSDEEWDDVYRVHVLGAFRTTRAAWRHMRERNYGRIVMTGSGSGLYGWFGQSNYAMAKMALVGLANALAIEGRARGILVNTICPMAGSAMSAKVWPADVVAALPSESVAALVAWLCHERCNVSGAVFEAGGGWFSQVRLERSRGLTLVGDPAAMLDMLPGGWRALTDFNQATHPDSVLDTYRAALPAMSPSTAAQWQAVIDRLAGSTSWQK